MLIYVGIGKDLFDRWRGHHILKDLKELAEAGAKFRLKSRVADPYFDSLDATLSDLRGLERRMITLLNPVINEPREPREEKEVPIGRRGGSSKKPPKEEPMKIVQASEPPPTARRSYTRRSTTSSRQRTV